MKKYCLIFLFTLFAGCSSTPNDPIASEMGSKNGPVISNRVENVNSPSVQPTPNIPPTNNTNAQISRNTGCEEYHLEKDKDNVNEFNLINIIQTGQDTRVIKLPTGTTVNGFALNYAKKTTNGFVFSVEYGSRYYYEKEFHFACNKGEFHLTNMRVRTHNQADPEKSYREFIVRIEPKVPLDEFSITKYMTE